MEEHAIIGTSCYTHCWAHVCRLGAGRFGEAQVLEEGLLRGLPAEELHEGGDAVHRSAARQDDIAVLLAHLQVWFIRSAPTCVHCEREGRGSGLYLGAEDALLLESAEHVGREDLRVEVAIVLSIVAARQMAEAGRGIGACTPQSGHPTASISALQTGEARHGPVPGVLPTRDTSVLSLCHRAAVSVSGCEWMV